jgi:NAD(P)H-flavin reductase
MSHRIIGIERVAPRVTQFLIEAPHVVRHARPGQFVIVRVREGGERIPLTIASADRSTGTIVLVVQAVGATTSRMCELRGGDVLADVVGPLGRPTDIRYVGHAVVVGGGVGTAVILPQAAALKAEGNYVSAIIGARSKSYVILERELSHICDAVYPCTDDGSYRFRGFVTQRLTQLIHDAQATNPVREVLCAGPVQMMRAVADLTRPLHIHTIASLNPIMVDGTGMCGGCRVQVDGRTHFACVDGPEFDAHQVDFADLNNRLSSYRDHERVAATRQREEQHHACHSAPQKERDHQNPVTTPATPEAGALS